MNRTQWLQETRIMRFEEAFFFRMIDREPPQDERAGGGTDPLHFVPTDEGKQSHPEIGTQTDKIQWKSVRGDDFMIFCSTNGARITKSRSPTAPSSNPPDPSTIPPKPTSPGCFVEQKKWEQSGDKPSYRNNQGVNRKG